MKIVEPWIEVENFDGNKIMKNIDLIGNEIIPTVKKHLRK